MDNYKRKNFLIILIAPSGGGKSTIAKAILDRHPDIEYSISYTTRKPRGDEKNGINYFFVSEAEFKQKADEGDFLEYAFVHGHWYGTSRTQIEERIKKGKHIILDIDINGAMKIVGSGIDAVTIFILPPSIDVLKERLIKRGTDSKETINLRLKNAYNEIKEIHNFQYLVINDKLEEAVSKVEGIIKSEENKVKRFDNILETFYGGKKWEAI